MTNFNSNQEQSAIAWTIPSILKGIRHCQQQWKIFSPTSEPFGSMLAGIGGCPFAPKATGNICTEDLVYMLEEMGIKTGIDIRKMMGIACDVEETVGRDLPGQVMKAGLRLDLLDLGEVATAKG